MLNRLQVVECNTETIPPSNNPGGAVSPLLSMFTSLRELCTSYPYGMGYGCRPNGPLAVRRPESFMFRGPPGSAYLRQSCQNECHCVDLGPDDPSVTTPERPACVAEIGPDVVGPVGVQPSGPPCTAATTLYPEAYKPGYKDRHWCDEFW